MNNPLVNVLFNGAELQVMLNALSIAIIELDRNKNTVVRDEKIQLYKKLRAIMDEFWPEASKPNEGLQAILA